jgi:hypothetical protein
MFEIASEVLRWHRSNETGVVARVVSVNGLATRWPAQAIAATGRQADQLASLRQVASHAQLIARLVRGECRARNL